VFAKELKNKKDLGKRNTPGVCYVFWGWIWGFVSANSV